MSTQQTQQTQTLPPATDYTGVGPPATFTAGGLGSRCEGHYRDGEMLKRCSSQAKKRIVYIEGCEHKTTKLCVPCSEELEGNNHILRSESIA